MKKRSFLAAAAMTMIVPGAVTIAMAQVSPEDARCRSAVLRASSKVGSAAMRAVDTCIKGQLAGSVAASADCNDVAAADLKDKVVSAQAKLGSTVTNKCDGTLNADALAMYPRCPSPGQAADDSGATSGIDSFAEVGQCQAALNVSYVEPLRAYVLSPRVEQILDAPNAARLTRCASAVAKGATKLWRTVSKERAKCYRANDRQSGTYSASVCIAYDDDGKIAAAAGKLAAKIDASCSGISPTDLALLGSCASAADDIGDCVASAVIANAGDLAANGVQHAEICPTQLRLHTRPGNASGQRISETDLDFGWTGHAHDGDFFDGLASRFALSCSSDDCESCAVTAACDEGNCRCSDDPTVACDMPFTAGGECGAGTCVVHFGPPRPRSAGGTPACVVDVIQSSLSGDLDAGSAALQMSWDLTSRIHLGIAQDQPCPTCSGATAGDAGTCAGGERHGLPCTTDAFHPDWGATSYDCPPTAAADLTAPDGLTYALSLTNGAVTLPAADPCDPHLMSELCHCGACSGDPTVACTSDAVCAVLGAGTCNQGTASAQEPNTCADLTCSPTAPGSAQGTCAGGPNDTWCDGLVRANGEGYVSCIGNTDCAALSAGNCAQSRPRDCFLPTIESRGIAGHAGGVIGAITCVPPSSSPNVNGLAGLPGPFRIRLAVESRLLCADGVTAHGLGGTACM